MWACCFPGFTAEQKRNLLFYTIGIMCYKLGLESALGSVKTMMTERFNSNPATSGNAFATIGLLEGLNQLCQSLGSIAVAPLIFRFKTSRVLATAITFFAAITLVFLIMEPATGGQIVSYITKNGKESPDPKTYGSWTPYILFPLFLSIGIAYGIIELIRRVIPRDIVGGDAAKLKKMDATVHIWYEVAGTSGAFFSAFMIQKLGHVYAMCVCPVLFIAAAAAWYQITSPERKISAKVANVKRSALGAMGHYVVVYFSSIVTGARIIFSSRKFFWLIPGYTIGLVFHRYLENGIAPNFSKIVLGDASYAQIMNGGSNFGELCGAFIVFIFNTQIHTPIPWVRWDALVLNLIWLIPGLAYQLLSTGTSPNTFAWMVAALFMFISMGWAAGDVSLAAYIQSSLEHEEDDEESTEEVSPLGAVMAFLYSSYIALYFCLNFGLGKYLDTFANKVKAIKNDKLLAYSTGIEPFYMIAGVMFSVGCVIILAGTFIPKGSFAINPTLKDIEEPASDAEKAAEKRHEEEYAHELEIVKVPTQN
ncbi:major facilitator superfamily domain-containing protein [Obelidium mucronatum]|nr:major facilitator superfamily domain-containing protein [Obelidium mucronatum]